MFIMPSEYTALQSRVKALETLVEKLEERIIALKESPAIEATKSIKQPVIPGLPVGYKWDDFKPTLKSNMLWPWIEDK